MQDSDGHLLTLFATHRDEAAFGELTSRHLGLIYHVALRRTGNRQMAEEVSQNVLCAVVRKAAGLARHPDRFSAWLHRATLFESSKAMRAEASHQRRKQLVHPDEIASTADSESSAWNASLPVLDLALDGLSDNDRSLVLRHYLEGRSFSQIGGETGRPAPTVQKQCRRAIEKLARILRGKGVTLSVTTLASGLAAQSAKAAPATLLKSAAAQAIAGASAYSTTSLTLLMATKSKAALPIALLVLLSPLALQEIAISKTKADNERLRLFLISAESGANRPTDRGTRRTVGTGERKITIDVLQRTLKQGDRSLLKRLEFAGMVAALDPAELEALIPQAFGLSATRTETERLSRNLVEALAKTDPGAALKAAFATKDIRSYLNESFLQEALNTWASAKPDEAVEWFKDLAARDPDKSGLDLLPLRAALAQGLILSGSPRVREILTQSGRVNPTYVIRDAVNFRILSEPEDPASAVERFNRFLPWIREVVPETASVESGLTDRSQVIGLLLFRSGASFMSWENPLPGKIMESGTLLPPERRIVAEYRALQILKSPFNTRPAPDTLEMDAAARDWLDRHMPEAAEEIFAKAKSQAMEQERQQIEQTMSGLSRREQLRDDEIMQALDRHDLTIFPEFLPRAVEQAGRIKNPDNRAAAIRRLQSTDTPKDQ